MVEIADMLATQAPEVSRQQAWAFCGMTQNRLQVCLLDNGKIRIGGIGFLDPGQTVEVGEFLVALAESRQNFEQPRPMRKIRVNCKGWKDARGGYLWVGLSWQQDKRARNWIELRADCRITPRLAREIGAYLCSIGMQQLGR